MTVLSPEENKQIIETKLECFNQIDETKLQRHPRIDIPIHLISKRSMNQFFCDKNNNISIDLN